MCLEIFELVLKNVPMKVEDGMGAWCDTGELELKAAREHEAALAAVIGKVIPSHRRGNTL